MSVDNDQLLMQVGKSKVQAKGAKALEVVKWPLRFFIFSLGCLVLCIAGSLTNSAGMLRWFRIF
jgi:hypothetical protein